jgi:SAM-dependent methyltransferase
MDRLRASSCPVCGGEFWFTDSLANQMLALDDRHSVMACATCRQRRLHPQLTPVELEAVYSGAYFAGGAHTALPGVAAAEADYATEVVEARRGKYRKTLRTIRALHPSARTLLDVGAATGHFVRAALDFGFEADGIEVSAFAVAEAAKANAVRLRQQRLADLEGRAVYDAVHLNHVFEHFNEPLVELAHLRRLLKPGGVLYVEVPYQFNAIERLKHSLRPQAGTLSLHSLHHAYFYEPRSLARMFADNGFEVRLLSVFDAERYPTDSATAVAKLWMWRLLSLAGIGTYIEVYAIRSEDV